MAREVLSDDDLIWVNETELAGVTDADPEIAYQIRKLTPTKHREIVKRHTKPVFERGVGRVEKTDGYAAMDDIIDHVLADWRGILLHGEKCPVTRDWKLTGLDLDRKKAIVDRAGMNEIAREPERRAESFPTTT